MLFNIHFCVLVLRPTQPLKLCENHFFCLSEQDRIPVMRGQWYIDGTWLPLEEDESDLIEVEHLAHFWGHQTKDTYEMEVVNTTVDCKDGKEKGLVCETERMCIEMNGVFTVYGEYNAVNDATLFVCTGVIQNRPQNKWGDVILCELVRGRHSMCVCILHTSFWGAIN